MSGKKKNFCQKADPRKFEINQGEFSCLNNRWNVSNKLGNSSYKNRLKPNWGQGVISWVFNTKRFKTLTKYKTNQSQLADFSFPLKFVPSMEKKWFSSDIRQWKKILPSVTRKLRLLWRQQRWGLNERMLFLQCLVHDIVAVTNTMHHHYINSHSFSIENIFSSHSSIHIAGP